MGYREMLLTIGAITIFSITTISVSRHMVDNTGIVYEQQAAYLLYGYANSIIQQAKTREFDETTINAVVAVPAGLTNPMQDEGGIESYPNQLDDVDDYNGLTETIDDEFIGQVNLTVNMFYVTDTDLNTPSVTPTFYKKMIVTATNDYVSQPVRAVYVFAYQRN